MNLMQHSDTVTLAVGKEVTGYIIVSGNSYDAIVRVEVYQGISCFLANYGKYYAAGLH